MGINQYLWTNVIEKQHNIVLITAESLEGAINMVEIIDYEAYIDNCKKILEIGKQIREMKNKYNIVRFFPTNMELKDGREIKFDDNDGSIILNEDKKMIRSLIDECLELKKINDRVMISVDYEIPKETIVEWIKNHEPIIH